VCDVHRCSQTWRDDYDYRGFRRGFRGGISDSAPWSVSSQQSAFGIFRIFCSALRRPSIHSQPIRMNWLQSCLNISSSLYIVSQQTRRLECRCNEASSDDETRYISSFFTSCSVLNHKFIVRGLRFTDSPSMIQRMSQPIRMNQTSKMIGLNISSSFSKAQLQQLSLNI
jgi:hypothetical protein